MRFEVIRVLQIVVCILIGLPGIYIVLRSNVTAVRAAAACITLLGLFFSWNIGCFIYEILCLLLEAIFMVCGYIFFIVLAVVIAFLPIILVLKWFFGR